jgi:hypothetical protein
MFRFLNELMRPFQTAHTARSTQRTPRRTLLQLEVLEDRMLLSAAPGLHHVLQHPKPHGHHKPAVIARVASNTLTQVAPDALHAVLNIQPTAPAALHAVLFFADVPNYSGDNFAMTSLDNGTTHRLQILSETYNGDGSANFTGTWDQQGTGAGVALTGGSLNYDAAGVHVVFAFGSHSFDGHITKAVVLGYTMPWYHIDGQVTVNGGGGPGHIVGDQNFVPDLAGVNFHLVAAGNLGTPVDSLNIQGETWNADGTASFTGLLSGSVIAHGTLSVGATGTGVTFDWDGGYYVFRGGITGNAGALHISGIADDGGGISDYEDLGPVQVSGDQV